MIRRAKPKARLKRSSGQQAPLLLLLLLIPYLIADRSVLAKPFGDDNSAAPTLRQYHVNLPRVGLISGLSISGQAEADSGPVVGFLGIPFAAPPVGPLRFMPPGAPQQQPQQQHLLQQPIRQLLLMANGQRASVRPFDRPGPRCVHLADWFNHSDRANGRAGNEHGHQDDNQDQFLVQAKRGQLQQSEDCLNLNVFVPIKANERTQTITSQQQQQHSIGGQSDRKPAADHAQFGHQGQSGHQRPTAATDAAQASWPLLEVSQRKLPVLVVIEHDRLDAEQPGQTTDDRMRSRQIGDRANEELHDHAKTALRTDSIVITFNYRTGLLGFLPYTDADDSNSEPEPDEAGATDTGNNKGRRQSQPARYNHAIWDQIGLLHWIKRNVQAFGGDPASVTLAAADNRASLHLQLLCMSPLAKGLFSRAILLQRRRGCSDADNNNNGDQVDLRQLVEVAGSHGLRRRLLSSLREIVSDRLNLGPSKNLYETLLSANIHQLAQIDHELNRMSSASANKMPLLFNEPSLDDSLLFPNLKPLIAHMRGQPSQANALLRTLESELNYCTYIGRIHQNMANYSAAHLEDPLQLVPSKLNNLRNLKSNDSAAGSGWHRESPSGQNGATRVAGHLDQQKSSASRSMAVQYFNHLNHLSSLDRLISTTRHHAGAERGDPSDDQQAHTIIRRRDLAAARRSSEATKRPQVSELHLVEDIQRLAELLSSVDIMFGYLSCRTRAAPPATAAPAPATADAKTNHHQQDGANFGRLAESLLEVTNSSSGLLDDNLLAWLKWIDFHSILSAGTSLKADPNMGTPLSLRRPHCDLPSSSSSSSLGTNVNETTKNSFVFILSDNQNFNGHTESKRSLLRATLETGGDRIRLAVRNFINFGHANRNGSDSSSQWPNYNTLSRDFEPVLLDDEERTSTRDQIRVQMDIVPYLSEDLPKSLATNQSDSRSPLSGLNSCLGELDLDSTQKRHNMNCLTGSLAKLRSLTRRYAAQDLESIISGINNRSSNQMWDFESDKSSGTSLITTRNLANQLSDMDETAGESTDPAGEQQQHSLLVVTNGSSSTSRQRSAQATGAGDDDNTTDKSLLRRFMGMALRDSVGRSLTIVVGAGLAIFLANLILVVVMTLRSSRQRRLAGPNDARGEGPTKSTNKVFASDQGPGELCQSGVADEVAASAAKPIPQHQQQAWRSAGNDQSLEDCLGPDKEVGPQTRLASSLRKSGSSKGQANGLNSGRAQAGKTKQLKFNLAHEDSPAADDEVDLATSDDPFNEHIVSFDGRMLELKDLMMTAHQGDSRTLILDTSPLMDVSQYLQTESALGHSSSNSECAIHRDASNLDDYTGQHHSHHHHHHQHHQHASHLQPLDSNGDQFLVATIQSPFNHSLTTASSSTSSTFRQKPRRANNGNGHPHHAHLACASSHSPSSSTTLSVTPNQQSDLNYPTGCQQIAALLDPLAHQYAIHNHNHNHDHTGDSLVFDQSEHDRRAEFSNEGYLMPKSAPMTIMGRPYHAHRSSLPQHKQLQR